MFSKYSKRNIISAAAHLNINQNTWKNESLINYPIKTEKYQYVPGWNGSSSYEVSWLNKWNLVTQEERIERDIE